MTMWLRGGTAPHTPTRGIHSEEIEIFENITIYYIL